VLEPVIGIPLKVRGAEEAVVDGVVEGRLMVDDGFSSVPMPSSLSKSEISFGVSSSVTVLLLFGLNQPPPDSLEPVVVELLSPNPPGNPSGRLITLPRLLVQSLTSRKTTTMASTSLIVFFLAE
jgi:hypothetical protein